MARIIKSSGKLYFSVSSGQTVGTALNTTGVTSIPVVLNLTTGNMGFGGTAAPAYPVDVTGTVNVSGVYRVSGSPGVTTVVPIAKLTTLGVNGALAIQGGIITGVVAPT